MIDFYSLPPIVRYAIIIIGSSMVFFPCLKVLQDPDIVMKNEKIRELIGTDNPVMAQVAAVFGIIISIGMIIGVFMGQF